MRFHAGSWLSLKEAAIQTNERLFADTLAAAAEGADWAIQELHDEFLPALTAFIIRRNVEDPEDLANWVLFEALRGLDVAKGNTREQFRALIYTIARRRSLNELRQKSVSRRHMRSLQTAEFAVDPVDDRASRVEEDHAERSFVHGLLGSLSPGQREVIEMRFFNDLSLEETATRIGKDHNAVSQTQHRALRTLRKALGVVAALALIWVGARALGTNQPEISPVISEGTTVPVDTPGAVNEDDLLPPENSIENSIDVIVTDPEPGQAPEPGVPIVAELAPPGRWSANAPAGDTDPFFVAPGEVQLASESTEASGGRGEAPASNSVAGAADPADSPFGETSPSDTDMTSDNRDTPSGNDRGDDDGETGDADGRTGTGGTGDSGGSNSNGSGGSNSNGSGAGGGQPPTGSAFGLLGAGGDGVVLLATATPTPTATRPTNFTVRATPTPRAWATSTPRPSATPRAGSSTTASPTATSTTAATPGATRRPYMTATPTALPTIQDIVRRPTPTATVAPRATSTSTARPTATARATVRATSIPTSTRLPLVVPATRQPTATPTSTATTRPSATPTSTATARPTATLRPSATPTSTATRRPTFTPTATPTATAGQTDFPPPTRPATSTPTSTRVPTSTPTSTPTLTPRPTSTAVPTATSTATSTPTPRPTSTSTATPRPTSTSTPTPTATASPTPTITPTATPTSTASPTPTPVWDQTEPPSACEAQIGRNWYSGVEIHESYASYLADQYILFGYDGNEIIRLQSDDTSESGYESDWRGNRYEIEWLADEYGYDAHRVYSVSAKNWGERPSEPTFCDRVRL